MVCLYATRAACLLRLLPRTARAGTLRRRGRGTGASDTASQGITMGICAACAIEPDDLLAKAREGLTRIWPDLRPVAVTHPAGSRA